MGMGNVRDFFRTATIEMVTMRDDLVKVEDELTGETGYQIERVGVAGIQEGQIEELLEEARRRLLFRTVGEMTPEELVVFEQNEQRDALIEIIGWGKEAEKMLAQLDATSAPTNGLGLQRVDDNAVDPQVGEPEVTPAVAAPETPQPVAPGKEEEKEGEEVNEPEVAEVAEAAVTGD